VLARNGRGLVFLSPREHKAACGIGAVAGIKGGWFGTLHVYPSEMAQNFWTAIFAWVGGRRGDRRSAKS